MVVASIVLAACGGGGGGESGSNTKQQISAPDTTTKTAPGCYLTNVVSTKPCAVDDWTVLRARINQGDPAPLKAKYAAMRAGGRYGICFTGGSITVGEKVWPDIQKAWAFKTFMWFAKTFPNSQFDYYNEAVSGTNSIVSQYRVGKMLDAVKCDVMFVEYAVNDINYMKAYPAQQAQAYASILDQSLNHHAVTIVFETMMPDCSNSEAGQVASAMNRNLMVISESSAICGETRDGTLVQADWNADGTHPNEYGHQLNFLLVSKTLERSL